eukprot:ANDGO_02547.mRNA.1 hypothetical protein
MKLRNSKYQQPAPNPKPRDVKTDRDVSDNDDGVDDDDNEPEVIDANDFGGEDVNESERPQEEKASLKPIFDKKSYSLIRNTFALLPVWTRVQLRYMTSEFVFWICPLIIDAVYFGAAKQTTH